MPRPFHLYFFLKLSQSRGRNRLILKPNAAPIKAGRAVCTPYPPHPPHPPAMNLGEAWKALKFESRFRILRAKHKKIQKNTYFFMTRTQYANFPRNPLHQATKLHRLKMVKYEKETYLFLDYLLSLVQCMEDCCMTMMYNRCDIMNIM